MINSARQSEPPPTWMNPEYPPSADGYAGLPATAAPAAAGPFCCSITLPAAAGGVAEAGRFVESFVDDPTLAANPVIHINSLFAGGRYPHRLVRTAPRPDLAAVRGRTVSRRAGRRGLTTQQYVRCPQAAAGHVGRHE
jgi:hypothetical protein